MPCSLNALEHPGINLYSNIPAVLSEIVADAWDADAENVTIDNAQSAYADYLEERMKVDKLWGVFEAIDDFNPPPKS
ncbi:MAG TPA: hypothetical protein GX686_02960 [Paracoccus sp.]|nr:hypothetical protein [Paracoccus sp. (in: a-proteobacteria)]